MVSHWSIEIFNKDMLGIEPVLIHTIDFESLIIEDLHLNNVETGN
jgi:hypothetical protein